MQKLQNELATPSKKQVTRVRMLWTSPWNEASAWAIEQYGLPGDRYRCHLTRDYMDFTFNDEQDAIHFNLRWL